MSKKQQGPSPWASNPQLSIMQFLKYNALDRAARRRVLLVVIVTCFSLICVAALSRYWVEKPNRIPPAPSSVVAPSATKEAEADNLSQQIGEEDGVKAPRKEIETQQLDEMEQSAKARAEYEERKRRIVAQKRARAEQEKQEKQRPRSTSSSGEPQPTKVRKESSAAEKEEELIWAQAKQEELEHRANQTPDERNAEEEEWERISSETAEERNADPNTAPRLDRLFTDPVWNVWAEQRSSVPLYRPQRILLPDHDYSVVVNSAAFGYDEQRFPSHDTGIYSQGSSSSFSKWVTDNSDVSSADVDILIIPDRVYFEPEGPQEAMKSLTVDLTKIRYAQTHGFVVPVSAVKTLSLIGNKATFTFGIRAFHVRTTDKTGIASIAISIWSGGRPVDEISFKVCVAAKVTEPCDPGRYPVSSFRGIDLGKPAEEPSAALHVIDRQSDIVGVFKCNRCDRNSQDYFTWEVPDTVDEFARQVKSIVRRLGRVSVNQRPHESKKSFKARELQEFLSESDAASDALYNIIFGRSNDGLKAKSAFIDFVLGSKVALDQQGTLSSLFVRLIPNVPGLLLTPVGLLRVNKSVPSVTRASTAQDLSTYVGFDVNIEMPLELQDYSASSECISTWTLFVPPDKHDDPEDFGAVESARLAFKEWIETFRTACGACVKDDESTKGFRDFLNGTGPDAGVVVMLSHHDDDFGLYFDENHQQPAILPSDIARTFSPSSVAILAGCGTAEPGGSEFIRKFNEAGVHTVLATTSAVDSAMSGRFLALLLDSFRQPPVVSTAYTLARARFDAVRKLSTEKDDAGVFYGPRALVFTLAGNGSRRLCVPSRSEVRSVGRSK
jgi:hypothetical protein